MQEGIIIKNVSNLYHVESKDGCIYFCSARGKIKNEENSLVVGDKVIIEITDNEKNIGVINEVKKRINYTKRPKMANITQIILVVSMKDPKPDLELLDKQLVYAESLNIKPSICLNKIDLSNNEESSKIEEIYKKIGYKVIKTNAKQGVGVEKIKEVLKNNITAFSGNSGVR